MYLYTYIHTYVRMYVCTYVCTYVRMYVHTYIHAYIHTHIHTGRTGTTGKNRQNWQNRNCNKKNYDLKPPLPQSFRRLGTDAEIACRGSRPKGHWDPLLANFPFSICSARPVPALALAGRGGRSRARPGHAPRGAGPRGLAVGPIR